MMLFIARAFGTARALVPAILLGLAAAGCAVEARTTGPVEVTVTSRPIVEFAIGQAESRFGRLEFVGGLEMSGSSSEFGGWSAFRFLGSGEELLAVSDAGSWLRARIERDGQNRPTGLRDASLQPILDAQGGVDESKWEVDAEGLGIAGGRAIVGFERNHRVAVYELRPGDLGAPSENLPFLVPARELRQNRGFETVAAAPADSSLAGAILVVSEKSLDRAGNIFGAVLSGPKRGVFTVKRDAPFDITDGDFLPNGDLLLLERSFSMADGVAMRLRLIPVGRLGPGQVADGEVIMAADMSFQIDNMEALDVWQRADGATMVSLMSDDNLSIFQRNLYLEFVLHGE